MITTNLTEPITTLIITLRANYGNDYDIDVQPI